MTSPMARAVLLCLAAVVGCSATESGFTSAADAPVFEFSAMESDGSVHLDFERRIGRADGSDAETFGFVADAVFGDQRSMYVADPTKHRITHIDSAGNLIRVIGRKGAGPGELMAPVRLAYRQGTLAVYDQALGRITVFDSSGSYQHQQPFPGANLVGDLVSIDMAQYAFTTSLPPAAPMAFVDRSGRLRPAGIHTPVDGTEAVDSPPTAGSLCLAGRDTLLYANPWIHEIVALPVDGAPAYHSWRRPSRTLRPMEDPDGHGGTRQGATLLGLACDGERVVMAYIVGQAGQVYYDVLARDGSGIGQVIFSTVRDTLHPGFVGDLEGSRLLTFRGRPYPHLLIFTIRDGQS